MTDKQTDGQTDRVQQLQGTRGTPSPGSQGPRQVSRKADRRMGGNEEREKEGKKKKERKKK